MLFEHDPPNKKQKSSATSSTSVSLAESTPFGTSTSTPLSSGSITPCSLVISSPAPLESDEFNLHTTPAPTTTSPPEIVTPAQPIKCKKCANYSKKRCTLMKEHNRLKKRFAKLRETLEQLQNVEVFFENFIDQCHEFNLRCLGTGH